MIGFRLALGIVGFCVCLGYGVYDVVTDSGFADGIAWILCGLVCLVTVGISMFEGPTAVFGSILGGVIGFLSVASILTHNAAAKPCNQGAYVDLMMVALQADGGLYGNSFSPSEHQAFRQMVHDCMLQGSLDELSLAGQMMDTMTYGPTSSILARSAGMLTRPAPQRCQDDYQSLSSVAPYLFEYYHSELACMAQPKRFWSW